MNHFAGVEIGDRLADRTGTAARAARKTTPDVLASGGGDNFGAKPGNDIFARYGHNLLS